MNEPDTEAAHGTAVDAEADKPAEPYQAPVLVQIGSLRDVQSGGSQTTDGGSTFENV